MTIADVRTRIFSAAKAVFSRKGYRAATVSDLIAEAGIARGTFYKHFPNKRQVLYEMVADLLKAVQAAIIEIMEFEGRDSLELLLRDSLELSYRLFLDNRPVMTVYFREAYRSDPGFYALWDDFHRRMTAFFTQLLQKGMRAGVLRPVDRGVVSRAMFMVFLQVPFWDILLGGVVEIDMSALADEMVRFVLIGLDAPGPERRA